MKHRSKSLFDEGVLRHSDIVNEVFDLHRKSHHFNIEKITPGSKKAMAAKVDYIPRQFIEQALDIYKAYGGKKKMGIFMKRPHPNYFFAVAKRLHMEDIDKYGFNSYLNRNRNNLGKSI